MRVSFMGTRKAGADDFHADRDQVASVQRYAAQHGATVEFMPPELSVSGGKPISERPSLKAAIEGVEAGIYDGIVVAYLSRLTRSRSGIEIWERVEAAGGHVHCAAENLDTSTPNGRFVRDIHLANAVREREEHVERFAARREGATAAGIWQRRQTPLGYARDPQTRRLVPTDDAQRVREAFHSRAAGKPLVHIARQLGMTASGVRNLLRNRVYLGELHVGPDVNTDAHPAIVTVAEWEAAQVTHPRPGRNVALEPALLAGIVRCQACGHVMTRARSSTVVYVCSGRLRASGCPAPAAVTAALLDDHVTEVVLHALAGLEVAAAASGRGADDAREKMVDAEAELAAYLAAVSAVDVGAEAFGAGARQRREAVEAATDEFRRRLQVQPVAPGFGVGVEAWAALDGHERNTLLRALLDVVVVRRAGGRGSRVPLADRVRVVAAGSGFPVPRKRGGDPLGVIRLPFPDVDAEGVLGVPGGEDAL